MLLSGVIWMGIRTEYRRDFEDQVFARRAMPASTGSRRSPRGGSTALPARSSSDVDLFVDRLWAIYYPALALDRVPAVMPHEDGEILWAAVVHALTPRVLFPDKPAVESDSEKVRRYTGVWVAGSEENTSIAFGYAAESYVDFGMPLMFLPVFAYGLLMGMAYHGLLRADPAPRARHRQRDRDLLALALPVRALVGQYARAVADAHRVSRRRHVPRSTASCSGAARPPRDWARRRGRLVEP